MLPAWALSLITSLGKLLAKEAEDAVRDVSKGRQITVKVVEKEQVVPPAEGGGSR